MDKLELPQDPELAKKYLENTHQSGAHQRELGALGKFFGSKETAKINIAGLFIFIISISGIVFTFILLNSKADERGITILELWGVLTPFITLTLGYIFGKNDN